MVVAHGDLPWYKAKNHLKHIPEVFDNNGIDPRKELKDITPARMSWRTKQIQE